MITMPKHPNNLPPIRILFVCHDGQRYGSQESLLLILKHLNPEQFQCYVSVARLGPLVDALNELPHVTVLRHKRIQWMKHDSRNPFKWLGDVLSIALISPLRAWTLYQWIHRYNIHIVHSNSVVSLEGAIGAWMAQIPHIWHIRELFMKNSPKLKPVLGRMISRQLIHWFSHRVVCISHSVRQQFEPYFSNQDRKVSAIDVMQPPPNEGVQGGKYILLHNAVSVHPDALPAIGAPPVPFPSHVVTNENEVVIPKRTHRFRLGYMGRLSEGKRFHDLVDAICLLEEGQCQVECLVAGTFVDEPYRKSVMRKVEQFELSSLIHFLGFVDNPAQLYTNIDALVVPSLNEPFGRVVIEAMAYGIPCIAARSGGIPEIIEDGVNGYLFTPKDIASLARMVREAATESQKRLRIRQQGRRTVMERFTIEQQIQQLSRLYMEAVQLPMAGLQGFSAPLQSVKSSRTKTTV